MKTLTIQLPDRLYDIMVSQSRKKGKELNDFFKESVLATIWEEKKKEVLSAYKENKLSIRETADLLGLTYMEADELLEKECVAIIR